MSKYRSFVFQYVMISSLCIYINMLDRPTTLWPKRSPRLIFLTCHRLRCFCHVAELKRGVRRVLSGTVTLRYNPYVLASLLYAFTAVYSNVSRSFIGLYILLCKSLQWGNKKVLFSLNLVSSLYSHGIKSHLTLTGAFNGRSSDSLSVSEQGSSPELCHSQALR